MENILKLSKYGLVETCKLVHEDVVTIVISKGFSEDAFKTFDFLRECHESFPNHPILETFITRKDLAVVVLKSNESQETYSE